MLFNIILASVCVACTFPSAAAWPFTLTFIALLCGQTCDSRLRLATATLAAAGQATRGRTDPQQGQELAVVCSWGFPHDEKGDRERLCLLKSL